MSCSAAHRPIEHQQLGLFGARGLELVERDPKAVRLRGHHRHGRGASQVDGFGVRGPVGRGDQDFVAGVQLGHEGRRDGVLAPVGDQHLVRGDHEAAVAKGLGDDRLAQLRQARGRRVLVVDRVVAGPRRGLDDVARRREVRFARAEADDGLAGGLQGLRLAVHGQGGTGGETT
jgi:hypothetical protein